MKLDISKGDLWYIRYMINMAVHDMETCPNPAAYDGMPQVGRKLNRKLNKALKKCYGHDCQATALGILI